MVYLFQLTKISYNLFRFTQLGTHEETKKKETVHVQIIQKPSMVTLTLGEEDLAPDILYKCLPVYVLDSAKPASKDVHNCKWDFTGPHIDTKL